MTRVAIVADTHGHLDAGVREAAAACDLVVHGGDVGAGAVLEALGAGGAPVYGVRGNNDQGDEPWVRELPEELRLDLPGGELAVVHGHQLRGPVRERHGRLRRRFPGARAVVYGHSHRLACDTDAAPWVLNPGAAGRARTYGGPSLLVLEAAAGSWRVTPQRFPPPGRGRAAPRARAHRLEEHRREPC